MALAYTQLTGANFALAVNGTALILPAGMSSPLPGSIGNISAGGQLQLGAGQNQANIAVSFVIVPQIPASGSATLVLSTTLTDICNQLGVTIVRIKAFLVQLLSPSQDTTYGALASSITLGAAAANTWVGILNSTGKYIINNGGFWAHGDFSPGGVAVAAASSDQLLFRNNDVVNPAGVKMTLFGCSS